MATALDVIKRSMRLIGALGDGENPTASEGADCLDALNGMLDAWWSKTLAVFYTRSESFTWPSATVSRTMGPTGDFVTTRPSQIVGAFQRISDIDYPIEILDGRAEYDRIPDKTTGSSLITRIYVEYQATNLVLYCWPVPNAAATVHFQSHARLQSFASLVTDVALPPGYKRALEYNLAMEIAPEFQVQVPPLVAVNAAGSLRGIKRTNLKLQDMPMEVGLIGSRRSAYNYYTGD